MPDRIKPLEGVQNFRDFGGYAVKGGGSLRRGRLYRTAQMSDATDTDIAFIDGLGIDFQVDLRRASERKRQPHAWAPDVVHSHDGDEDAVAPHVAYLLTKDVTPSGARHFMIDFYADAPFNPILVGLYRNWFEALDQHDGAGLINCAAGKDRTGLGCALTLSLMGVGQDDIIADYKKTNQTVDIEAAVQEGAQQLARVGRDVSPDALRSMFSVHTDYLAAAIGVIEDKQGSIRDYAREVLLVDDNRLERLYSKLVE